MTSSNSNGCLIESACRKVWLALAAILASTAVANATTPPARLNYQGVLRDVTGAPLDGDFDMVFRFWSAESAGEEILLDRHLFVNLQPVTVTGGLFSTTIGSGEMLDGSGPGAYATLAEVFRDYDDVWLEVQIGVETLAPRIAVAAAGYALNSAHLDGQPASNFLDTSSAEQTKAGSLIVDASGLDAYGIEGAGNYGGGFFADGDASGFSYVGFGDSGIEAYGNDRGGYFEDLDSGSYASLAHAQYGIQARGAISGGYFKDLNGSGYADVGHGDRGIQAYGIAGGGYFEDLDNDGWAYVGYGNYGIKAYGRSMGGLFDNISNSAYAYLAYSGQGIAAYGDVGGYFYEVGAGTNTWLSLAGSSIFGNGSKNFAQNHPEDPSRKIVYTSLEGNETGTYTRGSARLESGLAHIALDETFAWVTNPDLGLTAQVTPRDECGGLRVVSLTTEELVVQELGDGRSDAAFDWIVMGLRIGFEGIPVVQPRGEDENLPIPSMAKHRELLEQQPELEAFTPLERFRNMETRVFPGRLSAGIDLSRAHALVAAVHEFDPATDSVPRPDASAPVPGERGEAAPEGSSVSTVSSENRTALAAPQHSVHDPVSEVLPPPGAVFLPISGTVEVGDLLTLDADRPGTLRVATTMADPGVVGVAAHSSKPGDEGTGQAAVHCFGLTAIKADAGYGAIRAGDLLTSSATPGHAMLARTTQAAGTIIGKALEPLDVGTGTIRVLLMAR